MLNFKTLTLVIFATSLTGCAAITQKMETVAKTGISFNKTVPIDTSYVASRDIGDSYCFREINYAYHALKIAWPGATGGTYYPVEGFTQTGTFAITPQSIKASTVTGGFYTKAKMFVVVDCSVVNNRPSLNVIANFFGSNTGLTWKLLKSNGTMEERLVDELLLRRLRVQ